MVNDKFIPYGELPIDRTSPKLSWTPKKNATIENPTTDPGNTTKAESTEAKPTLAVEDVYTPGEDKSPEDLVFEPEVSTLSSPQDQNKLAAEKTIKDLQVNLLIAYLNEVGQKELAEQLEESKNLLTGEHRTKSRNFPEYLSMFVSFVQESTQILQAEKTMAKLDLDGTIDLLKKSGDRTQKALADCLNKMRKNLKETILANKDFNPTTATENLLTLKQQAIDYNRRGKGISSFVEGKLPGLGKKEIKDRLNSKGDNLLRLVKEAKELARRGNLDPDLSQAKFIAERFQNYFSFGSQVFRFAKAVAAAPENIDKLEKETAQLAALDALLGKRPNAEGNLAFLEDLNNYPTPQVAKEPDKE